MTKDDRQLLAIGMDLVTLLAGGLLLGDAFGWKVALGAIFLTIVARPGRSW